VRHRKNQRRSSRKPEKKQHRSRGGKHFFKHSKRTLTGRIQKKPQGFAFVISSDPKQRDAFVSRHQARLLMDGDIVEYKTHHDGKGIAAEVTQVLERSQKEVLGVFKKSEDILTSKQVQETSFSLLERLTRLSLTNGFSQKLLNIPRKEIQP